MSQLTFNPYIKRPKTQILINKLAKYYRDRNEKISIIKESKIQLSLLFFLYISGKDLNMPLNF